MALSRKLVFFANRNTQKNMQLLDKIHTVFTAALRVHSTTVIIDCCSSVRGIAVYHHLPSCTFIIVVGVSAEFLSCIARSISETYITKRKPIGAALALELLIL